MQEQRSAARFLFDHFFLTDIGVKGAMRDLGVTEETVAAWEASAKAILGFLNMHFSLHDFVLGGQPSTGDFGLLGPLYAHLYKDPVPGAMMHREFPNVVAWCERLHDQGGGDAVIRPGAMWLPGDVIPETLMPVLQVFFTEMWPVLKSTCYVLKSYQLSPGKALPGKSFNPESADQQRKGPLTHTFSLPFDAHGCPGGLSRGRRMVVPYHIWMLQRLEATLETAPASEELLSCLSGGLELLKLPDLLHGCRVQKVRGRIFPWTEPLAPRTPVSKL